VFITRLYFFGVPIHQSTHQTTKSKCIPTYLVRTGFLEKFKRRTFVRLDNYISVVNGSISHLVSKEPQPLLYQDSGKESNRHHEEAVHMVLMCVSEVYHCRPNRGGPKRKGKRKKNTTPRCEEVSSGDLSVDKEGFILLLCLQNLLEGKRERRNEVLCSPSINTSKASKNDASNHNKQMLIKGAWCWSVSCQNVVSLYALV
jgi:hypothetical protein